MPGEKKIIYFLNHVMFLGGEDESNRADGGWRPAACGETLQQEAKDDKE